MENRTFSQRVSDETLGSRDGFMCVLNHNPLGGADAEQNRHDTSIYALDIFTGKQQRCNLFFSLSSSDGIRVLKNGLKK